MSLEDIELQPDAARAAEGLRDMGYEFLTAVADVVDNSIEARASRIAIQVDRALDGAIEVSIADNGCGMDGSDLVDAMRYGSRMRDNPATLGKFGLGLKTASTAMCRQLTVISRPSGSAAAAAARWDLDHVATTGKWMLQRPTPHARDLQILDAVAPDASGTLVIWRKCDRVLPDNFKNPAGKPAANALNKQVEALKAHLGLVYVRFLAGGEEPGLIMSVNGEALQPWDPFCLDLGAEVLYDQEIGADIVKGAGPATQAPFQLRAYVLPPQPELDEAQKKRARIDTGHQGFYVFRENRVISYGGWLGMHRIEPHYNLARVELDFDHRLDAALHIDVKKSQIRLISDLNDFVKAELQAPRAEANQRYRSNERRQIADIGNSAHGASNTMIDRQAEQLSRSEVEVTGANEALVSNTRGRVRIEIPVMERSGGGPRVVVRADLEDGLLWRPGIVDAKKAVILNAGHEFYRKVYLAAAEAPAVAQGLDFLLWSLCEAELAAITTDERDHMQFVRREVSRIVRELSRDLPELTVDMD